LRPIGNEVRALLRVGKFHVRPAAYWSAALRHLVEVTGSPIRRIGRWIAPPRMNIRAVGSSVTLDHTEAIIASPGATGHPRKP
jgi:hypothetical protein